MSLRVVDSTGRLVGNAIGVDSTTPILSFEFDSIHFTLPVARNQFVPLSVPSLFYASVDCTGPAFLMDFNRLYAPALLDGPTLYLADTRVAPHTQTIQSGNNPGNGGCSPLVRTAMVFNTIILTNFTSQWSPPFKLK
jgi:hypothetical protein